MDKGFNLLICVTCLIRHLGLRRAKPVHRAPAPMKLRLCGAL